MHHCTDYLCAWLAFVCCRVQQQRGLNLVCCNCSRLLQVDRSFVHTDLMYPLCISLLRLFSIDEHGIYRTWQMRWPASSLTPREETTTSVVNSKRNGRTRCVVTPRFCMLVCKSISDSCTAFAIVRRLVTYLGVLDVLGSRTLCRTW